MARLKEADFYYGAILSTLINNNICPVLIEGDGDRQVYEFTTDDGDFRLFVKYRSTPTNTLTEGYSSWQFNFSDDDYEELMEYLGDDKHLSLGLVCGDVRLNESEYAVLNKEEIQELFNAGKHSFTISRKTGERAFRVPVEGSSRENAMRIPSNRLY